MMSPLQLNTSYKHHVLVAFGISLWLVIFLVVIAPFDAADLSFRIRLQILPFYGVISFLCYMLLVPLQNWIFKKKGKWTIVLEILFVVLYNLIALVGCFAYYQSDVINGDYPFEKFTFEVYYPIFFILLSILIFARWFLNRKVRGLPTGQLIIKGDNKLDVLKICPTDLVCVSSADNYVEVCFLKENRAHRKLLRTTLKNVQAQVPDLVRVHRSHLINPIHFKEWKGTNIIALTQMEVPVSKNYKEAILDIVLRP